MSVDGDCCDGECAQSLGQWIGNCIAQSLQECASNCAVHVTSWTIGYLLETYGIDRCLCASALLAALACGVAWVVLTYDPAWASRRADAPGLGFAAVTLLGIVVLYVCTRLTLADDYLPEEWRVLRCCTREPSADQPPERWGTRRCCCRPRGRDPYYHDQPPRASPGKKPTPFSSFASASTARFRAVPDATPGAGKQQRDVEKGWDDAPRVEVILD